MHHFVTEMCTCVHISVTKWYIVGYLSDALWDLWDCFINVLLTHWLLGDLMNILINNVQVNLVVIDGWVISSKIAPTCPMLDLTNDKPTLVKKINIMCKYIIFLRKYIWELTSQMNILEVHGMFYTMSKWIWFKEIVFLIPTYCTSTSVESLIWSKCINSLWPSNAIWWHRSGSTLAHVMACCRQATSHYLSQCWFLISEVLWHSLIAQATILCIEFENYTFKIALTSSRGQWVKAKL